jgi:hypothetical protein
MSNILELTTGGRPNENMDISAGINEAIGKV